MLKVFDKNLVPEGVLPDAMDVKRTRRLNSDYELNFTLPMDSEDFQKVQIKGHVQDERGQFYVINDRSRKRDGRQRLVEFDCMHVMFKMSDMKFPYVSYIEEAYGVNISTLLNSISAATGGKFTFVLDDSFDLKDVKDFGRGNCLQALNKVVELYGCEIEPDNFVIHIKKQIGADYGLQYRYQKNIINVTFRDSSRALVTRMYSQMKDGRTFIGMAASNLTTEEYALLNAVPGAIVDGIIRVNYLISPYAGYWSNTTNTYFDGETINQDIEDPLELLEYTRKMLRENEVPAIDVSINAADLNKIDDDEPQVHLGDTVTMFDAEMEINGITARAMEVVEYPFEKNKHPNITLANFFLRDYDDIIADLDKSKQLVDSIISGGKVRTAAFENFAAQAVHDINNSKSEVIYDERGIVLRSKLNHNDQVVLSSKGLYVTTDGGTTADAALTAAGLVAEKVIGKLGNFIEIEIGNANNVFKANASGIHLGHQIFASSPFRVNMAGQMVATQATITGDINVTSGTFSGNIFAYGTITGGTLYGAHIATSMSFPRAEMSNTGHFFAAYSTPTNFLKIYAVESGVPMIYFDNPSNVSRLYQQGNNLSLATFGTMLLASADSMEITTTGVNTDINLIPGANGRVVLKNWSKLYSTDGLQNLQQALNAKANVFSGASGQLYVSSTPGGPANIPVNFINGLRVS